MHELNDKGVDIGRFGLFQGCMTGRLIFKGIGGEFKISLTEYSRKLISQNMVAKIDILLCQLLNYDIFHQ